MPDQPPPLPASNDATGPGPPRFAWFDGILTGPRPDPAVRRQVTGDLRALGLGDADIEMDAGRCTLMLPDRALPGRVMNETNRTELIRILADFVQELPPGEVGSTLRCTEIFAEQARETVFVVVGRHLRAVSRMRPLTPDDRTFDPTPQGIVTELGVSRRRLVIVAGLLLLTFGIVSWQSGWWHRILSRDSVQIRVDEGSFAGLLTTTVKSSWGNYEVTIKRGGDYPDPDAASTRAPSTAPASTLPTDRVARSVVAVGGEIYVRIENDRGEVVAFEVAQLRALVVKASGSVVVQLPGRMDAASIHLALDDGGKR